MNARLLRVLRPVVALYGYAELLWGLRKAPRSMHGTIPIFDVSIGETSGEHNLAKVAEALDVLQQYDLQRYKRMERDIRRILVAHYDSGYAGYMPALCTIIIQSRFLNQQPAASTSAVIVHEAIHARIWNMGVRSARSHDRLERRCNIEMRRYAERLPNGKYLVDWATQLLQADVVAM